MIDPHAPTFDTRFRLLKASLQFGLYVGSGLGLAMGSAISAWVGSNLIWQTGGLAAGAIAGMASGATYAYFARRLKPAPVAYRG